MNYGVVQEGRAIAKSALIAAGPMSVSDRLLCERDQLKSRLEQVESALAALESNPGVREVVDTISRVIGHY